MINNNKVIIYLKSKSTIFSKIIEHKSFNNFVIFKYKNIWDTVKLIENNYSKYKKIIIIDDFGVLPFLYLSKVDKLVVASSYSEYCSKFTSLHNNARILCMGEKITGVEIMMSSMDYFINTNYEGGRHSARLNMLNIETKNEK